MKDFFVNLPIQYIIISVVAIVLLIIIIVVSNNKSKKRLRQIKKCQSTNDINYQLHKSEARMLRSLQQSKIEINNALKLANIRISSSWINSCERVMSVANNLQKNIEHHKISRLQTSKFHQYTNLWFRSMLAADLTYGEFKDMKKSCKEINELLSNMRTQKTIQVESLQKTKVEIKKVSQLFLKKVHELNQQTAFFRDKIGVECGARGAEWAEARKKHH